jgi:hypothetical protein
MKKAGIIVAATVAGVVALSPFAFADPGSSDYESVETTTTSKDNQEVECDFENNQAVTGAGGLAGLAVGVPVNATIPVLSCNNTDVEDVVDLGTNNPNTEVATTD